MTPYVVATSKFGYAFYLTFCHCADKNHYAQIISGYVPGVIAIIAKLQEKSLLQYAVVGMASSLSPHNMVRAKEKSLTCINLLTGKGAKLKWMSPDEADEAKTKYLTFIDTECVLFKDEFLVFDAANDCVDTFLVTFLHGQKEYTSL